MQTPKHPPSRSRPWRILLAVGLFLIGSAVVFALPRAQQEALANNGYSTLPLVVNYPAPEINLVDLEGKAASLSDYQGKVVLVNNWATWCPPCESEMPTLQAYYKTHAGQGFVIVAIESGESAQEVAAFVRNYRLSFPVWLDRQQTALEVFRNWNLPSSYVIDRTGTVRLTWTGEISRQALEQYVTPLLEK